MSTRDTSTALPLKTTGWMDRLDADARERVALTLETVREMSRQVDPQAMVEAFRRRISQLSPRDEMLSLSRRDLAHPWFRITRSSRWDKPINPWLEKERLPLCKGGLLAELLYANEPAILHELEIHPEDPAAAYLDGMCSAVALPLFDKGESLNMVVLLSRHAADFESEKIADQLLNANLFGLATHYLVLASRLEDAYRLMDDEMKKIGELQRTLLPATLPRIPNAKIATYYRTAASAGGDYYDFFDLGHGRFGLLIGDVSGHGASAAVVMAIARTLLHAHCQEAGPAETLAYVNRHLNFHSGQYECTFVTAFYGLLDTTDGSLQYACAGHPPAIVVRGDETVEELDRAQALPLGIMPGANYIEATSRLRPGDTLMLYTDGVTEAMNPAGDMYGHERLLECVREPHLSAQGVVDCITQRLAGFTEDCPPQDDQTLVTIRFLPHAAAKS